MTRARILIVEDEKIIASRLERILEELEYSVTATASSGEEAIRQASETKPDLVLMDIHLAGEMDGVQAAEEIRVHLDIPVIYLTAYDDDETLQRVKISEPFGYILIPFDEGELRSMIEIGLYKHEKEKRLKESEERYHGLFDDIPVGIYRTTPEGQILDANSALVNLLGYPNQESLLTANVNDIVVTHEERLRFQHLMEDNGIARDFEVQLRRYDGMVIWVRDNGRAIRDDSGLILYYEGVIEDITEHKRAEEQLKISLKEKEVLLEEIHHRIRNNMQVINSLLNLQFSYIEDEQVVRHLKVIQNRIRAMALVHDKLDQLDVTSINLKDYIEDLARALLIDFGVSPGRISFRFDTDPVLMPIDSAVSCGLLINELLSNSLKHAFPGSRTGEIHINLCQMDKGYIELRVSDNGVGIPVNFDVEKSNTLGFKLIRIILEHQLNGSIELKKREPGTECVVRIKPPYYKKRI